MEASNVNEMSNKEKNLLHCSANMLVDIDLKSLFKQLESYQSYVTTDIKSTCSLINDMIGTFNKLSYKTNKIYESPIQVVYELINDFQNDNRDLVDTLQNLYKQTIHKLATSTNDSDLLNVYHDFIVLCQSRKKSISDISDKITKHIENTITNIPNDTNKQYIKYKGILISEINKFDFIITNIIKAAYNNLKEDFTKYQNSKLIIKLNKLSDKLTESEMKKFEKQMESISILGYYENQHDTKPITSARDGKYNLNDYLKEFLSLSKQKKLSECNKIKNTINYILEQHYDLKLNKIKHYTKSILDKFDNNNVQQLNNFYNELNDLKANVTKYVQYLFDTIDECVDKMNTERRFIEKLRFPAVAV